MSICVGNVEKFFKDHPKFKKYRKEVIERARIAAGGAGGGDIISGSCIEEVFGSFLAPHFRAEMMSIEHIKIGVEALQKAGQYDY